MNVLIISKSDIHGGAAIAAYRLMNALKSDGENVKMAVFDKKSNNPDVIQVGNKLNNQRNFYFERGTIFIHNKLNRENLFAISIANTGVSITELDEFKNADVIHLHWINQGMLSIKEIGKILQSGKKVVWTMHDMWPFTGICHYAGSCTAYTSGCGLCPYLKTDNINDLSHTIFTKKISTYTKGEISFVACSNWLKNLALRSPLTAEHDVVSIPNLIDTQVYRPMVKKVIRAKLGLPIDKKIILFASVKASDKRKGMDFLIESTGLMKHLSDDLLFIIAGNQSSEVDQFVLPFRGMGYIPSEKMPELYNAADLFVSPSLQDNLPNTIMEAMSCGIPCIGFDTGGIPEMIDHLNNGYVAKYKNAKDLAEGIEWALFRTDLDQLSKNARSKVLKSYSESNVVNQYKEIYGNY